MLVLARRPGEKIFIYCPDGEVIEILLVETTPGKARIGFNCSMKFKIARDDAGPNKKAEYEGE